jgi:hypothetical protein
MPLSSPLSLVSDTALFFHHYGYLSQPWFYEPGGTWMGWFSLTRWADRKGAYDVDPPSSERSRLPVMLDLLVDGRDDGPSSLASIGRPVADVLDMLRSTYRAPAPPGCPAFPALA